jgi:hypothetical protein
MKKVKILKILTLAVVLSILLLMVPVLPALAISTTLSPNSGKIGNNIDVIGDSFTAYRSIAPNEYFAEIYFAEENVIIGKSLDIDVKSYKWVAESDLPIDATTGDFTALFQVPSILDDYSVASYHHNVNPGSTYYVYVTIMTNGTLSPVVRSKATFAVTASAALDPLSPATGPAGTDVTVSGANFPASTALVFKFDTTTIAPKSGDTTTRSSGIFISTITIPTSAAAGAHTITVTAGTGTANATFTVTASAALDPLSPATGPAGTDVAVSGSNFPASTALVFKFDTTTVTPKAGTDASTRSSGIFISTITVPAGATAGAHTITVTAGTGTANATFTVTVSTTLNPLDPTSGPVGTEVNISGTNGPPNTAITYKIDTTTLTPKTGSDVLVRSSGNFYAIITIPVGTTSGVHTISVTVGTTTFTPQFTVTGATPTPTPTSNAVVQTIETGNNVGATVAMAGAGFTPSANVSVKWDNSTITTTKANADGTISVNFQVPAGKGGTHNLVITDGTNSATANFTVETTPPTVPSLGAPTGGAKAKTPITLTWGSVTDVSSPVTYELQIASDVNFTTSSIELDKKALANPEYTLTATEETALAGGGAPNYWRIKAIDAAQNESAWTAAANFQISVQKPFPTWAYIVIGVVGGLLVFFIGFWIGRRMAFSY